MSGRRPRARLTSTVAVAGITLALGACSSESVQSPSPSATAPASTETTSSPSQSGGRDPCSLTSPTAIAVAFGGTVAGGVVDRTFPDPQCKFTVTGSNLGIDGTVVVFQTPEQTEETFRLAKQDLPDLGDAPGVGDDAFYN